MSDEDWSLSLAQAEGFARTGATDEAIARALGVHRATGRALARASTTPGPERDAIQGCFERSGAELRRYREMHALTTARTAARSDAYYERERRDLAYPSVVPPVRDPSDPPGRRG